MPGGGFQVPLLKRLRERGIRVICSDRSESCPGRPYADIFVPLGVNDREALLKHAQELKPDGFVTDQTDAAVMTVAWLTEQLNLPGIGMDCADLYKNKVRMREFSRDNGFPVPGFALCRTLAEAQKGAARIGYPVVVKPSCSQSSQGVNRVDDPSGLDAAFREAEEFGEDRGILIEELLVGTGFTVEGFKDSQRHHSLAISEESHFPHRPMVPCCLVYSPTHPQFDYAAFREQNDRYVDLSGLPFGITHAEYKFTRDGRFVMIEIAARGGGTRVSSDMIPRLSGVPIYDHYIDAVLGKQVTIDPMVHTQKSGILDFLHFTPGKIRGYEGVEEARAIPGMVDVVLNYPAGGTLPNATNGTNRAGYYLAITDTREEAEAIRDRVRTGIRMIHE